METRYLVMKISDMIAAKLSKEESQMLFDIIEKVNRSREERVKPPLKCVVVESDWPEYEPVCDSIESRIRGEESTFPGILLTSCGSIDTKTLRREVQGGYTASSATVIDMTIIIEELSERLNVKGNDLKTMTLKAEQLVQDLAAMTLKAEEKQSELDTILDKYAAKCNESNVRGTLLNHCVEALREIASQKGGEQNTWEWECDKAQETLNKLPFDWDEIPSSIPNSEDYMQDAKRYKRLRILGCAPMDTPYLDNGTVLRFTNLDEFLDNDIKNIPSRGEA